MTAEALVVKAGIATTVQDLGRVGYRAQGVPCSGALDPLALALVNLAVGNPPGTGALEMLYSGVVLEARGGAMRAAVGGAQATIETRSGAALRLAPWQSMLVQPGERVRVGPIVDAAAAYLAVECGFAIAPVLGSVATYVRGALGGWHGRRLRAGDALPLVQRNAPDRPEQRLHDAPNVAMPRILRVQAGPHADRFAGDAMALFTHSDYTVTAASDRSGLRLEGPRLEHARGYDLPSEGLVAGSIQVPGSGQPVLLVADHPTVGGYPRIATIVSADLAAAGRLRIGATVRFAVVDAAGAARARDEAGATYARICASLGPVPQA